MTSRGALQPKLYVSNKNDCKTLISGVPVSTCTVGLHLTLQKNLPLLLIIHLQRLFPETLSPPGRCHLPCPQACPSRARTRQADSLPPSCPDAGSAGAQHTICTLRTNKSGGPSAMLPARHSCSRQHAPLCDAAWAQACSTAQDCAFSSETSKVSNTDHDRSRDPCSCLDSLDLLVIKTC